MLRVRGIVLLSKRMANWLSRTKGSALNTSDIIQSEHIMLMYAEISKLRRHEFEKEKRWVVR